MKFIAKIMDVGTADPLAIMCAEDAILLGLKENDRVRIDAKKSSTAMLDTTRYMIKKRGLMYLSDSVMNKIEAKDGDEVDVVFAASPECIRTIRKKMDKEELTKEEISEVVKDILNGKLSRMEISAWLTALYINGMNIDEIAAFTQAMVDTGDRIEFDRTPVYDFHSMGGVPGNKITPIVVSIVASAGMMLPKTSSRAISSACGTSDFVETFCNVELDARTLKKIAEETGGVFAWGGSMNLAPVDDMVIKIEHPLGINPRAQMLASILSKKVAVGATHLVIDIPTGEGTKVKTLEDARLYARDFMDLGERLGIRIECAITYADQPVGSAIGPILEARECIRILEGNKHPESVIEKACDLAGMILEMGGINNGPERALEILNSGKALKKFREIVAAQGGNYDIKSDDLVPGKYMLEVSSVKSGYVHSINNKDLVSIAKAAGSPNDKGAGLMLLRKKGQRVEKGDILFQIYGESEPKVLRAKDLAIKYQPIVIEGMLIKKITASKVR
ncbi:MAG: AMP phosphorylase [Candidatus Methanomethylophilaceae archaeon]|nr:AMP phosphorylase [Candidatus Methanomethylophilaceae archaeon]MDD3378371.1 AMP phosphorylase [Candidatus Methanomethylophilaceae archaeon]MDY0223881.1 AMP phosphorylase [Candidatus Methanomethylophilaceae archaeon]